MGALRIKHQRPTHDIARAAKNLCQAGDEDVDGGEDIHVDESADGVVADDGELVSIGDGAEAVEVRGVHEGVGGEFAEEGCDAGLCDEGFDLGKLGGSGVAVEADVEAATDYLEGFDGIEVEEARVGFVRGRMEWVCGSRRGFTYPYTTTIGRVAGFVAEAC